MATKRRERFFYKRLNLVRFAHGFRDIKHHLKGDQKGQPNLADGKFPFLFLSLLDAEWPGGKKPADVTVKRWFDGTSDPGPDNLHGIAKVLNSILANARKDEHYLRDNGAEKKFLFDEKFFFTAENLSAELAPRHFAKEIGFDIDYYDRWWEQAQNIAASGNLDAATQKFAGFYFAYRFLADEKSKVQRNAVIIRENEDRSGLDLWVFGGMENLPWRGELAKGQNTFSALITRSNEEIGTHINTVTLVHNDQYTDILHGYRTRIVERNTHNIASYRTIFWRMRGEYEGYAAGDLEDEQVLKELAGFTKEFEPSQPGVEPFERLLAETLSAKQPEEIGLHPYFIKEAHNIFSLTRELIDHLREIRSEDQANDVEGRVEKAQRKDIA